MNKRKNNQNFYYNTLSGRILGGKAREKLIDCELKKISKNDSFLEVGCAQGHYLEKALKRTKKVFGIDVVPGFVEKAKKTGAKAIVASGEKIPFKKEIFDFVLCTETLEHIPDWKKAVKEIKRVLKKDGVVVVTIPLEKAAFWKFFSIFFPPKETRGHVNLLYSKEIVKEFKPLKMEKKEFIQTMSITFNKVLPQREKISMYCFFVFRKK